MQLHLTKGVDSLFFALQNEWLEVSKAAKSAELAYRAFLRDYPGSLLRYEHRAEYHVLRDAMQALQARERELSRKALVYIILSQHGYIAKYVNLFEKKAE